MDPDRWQRLEPLLDAVLDLAPEERASYLDVACSGDPELRREVEALLEDCEASGDFLEKAGGPALAEVAASSPFDPLALDRIGSRIGPYRLEEILGQGGMGTVYLARRADGQFDQKVAIKVANRHDLDREAVERFRFERQLLARLEHPGIARLFDGGVTEDDTPYLVMELVDGGPLDEHCEGLGLDGSLGLVLEAAEAVAYAHRRQVVHRDLKPSNILVTREGAVKLLDFGVAELLSPSGDDEPPRAATDSSGDRLTLGYAAPELLLGEQVTDACDTYALGVLLYRLLTGELPFSARGVPVAEFIQRVVHEEPEPPSSAARRSGARPVPDAELDAIVLKALAKKPESRYRSVEALVEDLERYRSGQPVLARPQTLGYVLRKHLARHRWAWLAGGVAAALLLLASAGWVNSRRQSTARAEIARLFGQEAERIEWFLRHAKALPLHDLRREQDLMVERLDRLKERIETVGPFAQGPGSFALGRGYAQLGRHQEAAEYLLEAWESGYRTAEVSLALGKALGRLYDAGRAEAMKTRDPDLRAARIAELGQRFRDRALFFLAQAGSPELESSSVLFGLIAFYDDRLEEALRRALEAQEEYPWMVESVILEGDVHRELALAANEAGRYDETDASYSRALDTFRLASELAPSDPAVYERSCEIWLLRMDSRRLQPEAGELDVLLASGLDRCGLALRANPESVSAWHLTASLYMVRLQDRRLAGEEVERFLGRAEEALRTALDLRPDHAASHHTLGTVHLSRALKLQLPTGKDPRPSLAQAAVSLRRAVELDPSHVSAHANLGTTLALTAAQQRARGDDPRPAFDGAVASFQQALDRSPGKVLLLYNMANLLRDKGEFELSRGLDPMTSWRAAADYAHQTLERNPRLVVALNLLGALEEAFARQALENGEDPAGNLERALGLFDRVLEVDPRYFRAAVNQASTFLLLARSELPQGRIPDDVLDRAVAAADRAAGLSGSTEVEIFEQLGESRLLRAEADLARGGDGQPWLDQATKALQRGLGVHPIRESLTTGLAHSELLRRLAGGGGGDPCLLRARELLVQLLEKNPEAHQARLLLAEIHLWCAVESGSETARQAWLDEGRKHLQEAGTVPLDRPSREVLHRAFELLASPRGSDLWRAAAARLRRALGEDPLLRWRFEPLVGEGETLALQFGENAAPSTGSVAL